MLKTVIAAMAAIALAASAASAQQVGRSTKSATQVKACGGYSQNYAQCMRTCACLGGRNCPGYCGYHFKK